MIIACTRVGVYEDNLTRGQCYEVMEEEVEKRQVRVKDNKGRLRWFPTSCFDFENQPVLTLAGWQFDDEIEGDRQTWIAEIRITLNDGSLKFCIVATPQTIAHLLVGSVPYFWDSHLVVVPSYAPEIVEKALRDLDAQGNLLRASYSIESSEPIAEEI